MTLLVVTALQCIVSGDIRRKLCFCPLWPWPLTLTFELFRARDQTRLPCELGANPFSGSRDISYTNKKSQTAPKTEPYAVHCVGWTLRYCVTCSGVNSVNVRCDVHFHPRLCRQLTCLSQKNSIVVWMLLLMCGCDRQVGDLGNVQPDANGRVTETRQDRLISLFGENNIVGRVADVRSFSLPISFYLSFVVLSCMASTSAWLVLFRPHCRVV